MMRYIRMALRALLPSKPAARPSLPITTQDHADKRWLRQSLDVKREAALEYLGDKHVLAGRSFTWRSGATVLKPTLR